MRRKRTTALYFGIFLVPAVVGAFGIRYFYNQAPISNYFSANHKKTETAKLEITPVHEEKGESSHDHGPASAPTSSKTRVTKAEGKAPEPEDEDEPQSGSARHPLFAASTVRMDASGALPVCSVVEFRGEGVDQLGYTEEEWIALRAEYRRLKKELLTWLDQHKKEIGPDAVAYMDKTLRNLKIQRPPVREEPDLAWRGIATLARSTEDDTLIRVGGGFMKLVRSEPDRARFEITRLLAQAWVPCELAKAKPEMAKIWNPLLSCLGVTEKQGQTACGPGSYSEAGWAVSSAMAATIAPPGCSIPAFKEPAMAECLKKFPLGAEVAGNSNQLEAMGKVAHR